MSTVLVSSGLGPDLDKTRHYELNLMIIMMMIKQDGVGPVDNDPPPISFSTLSKKKSRIRETKHLSTDADSSTDVIGGWTKNIPKPDFFEKRKKIIKNAKTQKHLEICQN